MSLNKKRPIILSHLSCDLIFQKMLQMLVLYQYFWVKNLKIMEIVEKFMLILQVFFWLAFQIFEITYTLSVT